MSSAVFRDPVDDGATDPTLILGPDGLWRMFYTQRRPSATTPGVSWVHGSRIGIAVSPDGGRSWEYQGTLNDLDEGGNTHWAPEIIAVPDGYRMYLTVVPGIPESWDAVERHIVEYRSRDLENWVAKGTIALSSERVIDAAVARCVDGGFRLWYKDEDHDSTTWAARSDDLESWHVEGPVIVDNPHEGPNVFELGGWFWMIVDEWRGLAVHRSSDSMNWTRQATDGGLILHRPGASTDDREIGHHADVVTARPETSNTGVDSSADEATIFYFTHPAGESTDFSAPDSEFATRSSAIHRARLTVEDGTLRCDRDVPADDPLPQPPANVLT